MVVVETNDINHTALEEMVVRGWFITAGSDGTRLVVLPDDIRQMDGQQGVRTQLPVLGQRGSITTRIEQEVGLFQGQLIIIGARPLFQHLITDAPHQDTRMVTVA